MTNHIIYTNYYNIPHYVRSFIHSFSTGYSYFRQGNDAVHKWLIIMRFCKSRWFKLAVVSVIFAVL